MRLMAQKRVKNSVNSPIFAPYMGYGEGADGTLERTVLSYMSSNAGAHTSNIFF